MPAIVTKTIKGKAYLYLVESVRTGSRVRQRTIKYIGPKRPVPRKELECMLRSRRGIDWILPAFTDQLSYQDHYAMLTASKQYRLHLAGMDRVSRGKERERFLAAFIAHSNAIEGSTLTVQETFDYLFKDLSPLGHSRKELHMAANMLEAWQYLDVRTRALPSMADILSLHAIVNRGIEERSTLGRLKRIQNYIGDIPTTSPLWVEERMEEWLRWIREAFAAVDDFEVAFQSHAQFEVIHPFIDGNGRVGRLLLNWLLLHRRLAPLAVPASSRPAYLSALENARLGQLRAICRFFLGEYLAQYRFEA